MALRSLIGMIAALLFYSLQAIGDELAIKADHPERYTVVKGDTLWDISAKYLQQPWRWPELWEDNPQIKNPHWIYPGDTLYFSYVNGAPRLSLSPFGGSGGEQRLEPRIREADGKDAIKMIPADAIAQFLSAPLVVGQGIMEAAPYVVSSAGEHLVSGAGDSIYVRAIEEPEGPRYTVYRSGGAYVDPATQEVLGYEAKYIASALLESAGDPATLRLEKTSEQVKSGDRVLFNRDNTNLALNYFPKPPEHQIRGNILRVLNGVTEIGQYDIVAIDKGTVDGLKPGHTLLIYHRGKTITDRMRTGEPETVTLPDEYAGVIMVFRPFDRVSYALVMSAVSAIHTLDHIRTP
jgi:LysM domain